MLGVVVVPAQARVFHLVARKMMRHSMPTMAGPACLCHRSSVLPRRMYCYDHVHGVVSSYPRVGICVCYPKRLGGAGRTVIICIP